MLALHESDALAHCRAALPAWRDIDDADFVFAPPMGFSSFTMGIRCEAAGAAPSAVLYRRLAGKENAVLDFEDERRVYLELAERGVAARCLAYERDHRIEAFYEGRTLTRHDLGDPATLRAIGAQLARLHAATPAVPSEPFFDRLFARWAPLARRTLVDARARFPAHEQAMCAELLPLLDPTTLDDVRALVPPEPRHFCHNDTYHGNTFLLSTGEVRLLDFEFSCVNHPAFDFANLFAETVTRHGLPDDPHFAIADPEYTRADVSTLVEGYLAAADSPQASAEQFVDWTFAMIPLSDFMYAMAALPLATAPIQKLRFIPYALTRFRRFQAALAKHGR